ncbi:flagellar motor stator protein MotA [Parvularcula sp. ZS-1/3]|uniref:Flagellar motor stator protein MotA n=1 Tax=Parvularcula mediterranea TaxID=2732508 RepID=A0A7Y3W4C6_9PROT|nr:flagellar motor stator protein MotA [Parvularcula mediterranea]NNU15384.1 flagellar motor stator protein MotA [Parvularcula mediterranea]
MITIIGLIFTVLTVFGGYMLAGGNLDVILKALPFEMLIIGGSAFGAFIASNNMSVIKQTGGDLMSVIKGPKFDRSDYQDLLCLLHTLLSIGAKDPTELEKAIEDPQQSEVFAPYPKIVGDADATQIICDTMRSMIMNFDNAFQVEEMLEKQLYQMKSKSTRGAEALGRVADALPALGIVAAVLGVIKTMASIDKPPEVLGLMIGSALVGTFLGVYLAYGMVGPLAERVKQVRSEEQYFYGLIREVLVHWLHSHPPVMCVEVGRRNAPKDKRPSFQELDDAIRSTKKAA